MTLKARLHLHPFELMYDTQLFLFFFNHEASSSKLLPLNLKTKLTTFHGPKLIDTYPNLRWY